MDVIWLYEYAFSVGEVSGTVWVTCCPGEKHEEDCLVFCFPRLTTFRVQEAIYENQKSSLVIWNTPH